MFKIKKSVLMGLLGLVAGGFMAVGTQAGEGPKGCQATFSDFDLDGDGKIVEQEFNEGHAKRKSGMEAEGREMQHAGDFPGFSGIDSNEDGEISKEEFAAHQAEQMHKHQQGN